MGWFVDLTAMDPYFILPILTASTLALNMKYGLDAADSSALPPLIEKFLKYGIPVMTLMVTCTFPSALCVYWFTSNVISLAQSSFLRIPAVKNAIGLEDLKKWEDSDLPMNKVGFSEQWDKIQPTNKMNRSRPLEQDFDKMGIEEALRKAQLKEKNKEK